jgi:hypothetical protein
MSFALATRAGPRRLQPDLQGHHRPDQGGSRGDPEAASVAALLITTEAMVAELPKKNADAGACPAGGGEMGGMGF